MRRRRLRGRVRPLPEQRGRLLGHSVLRARLRGQALRTQRVRWHLRRLRRFRGVLRRSLLGMSRGGLGGRPLLARRPLAERRLHRRRLRLHGSELDALCLGRRTRLDVLPLDHTRRGHRGRLLVRRQLDFLQYQLHPRMLQSEHHLPEVQRNQHGLSLTAAALSPLIHVNRIHPSRGLQDHGRSARRVLSRHAPETTYNGGGPSARESATVRDWRRSDAPT